MRKIFIPFLVFVIAAFIYSQYGFRGQLLKDDALYLYSGQRMAQGVPPYVAVLQIKGPLAPMLTGLGAMVSQWLAWDDIFTVRLVFFLVGCLAVVAVYLLGDSLFRSQRAGVFGALAFLGFFGFARRAASGPDAKTPMVLFETLSLLLTSQRNWFLAGLCGSLSTLTWQPTAIFPLVTLLLAAAQPRKERIPAISRALAGIGLPVAIVAAYFYYHGAFDDLVNATILFPLLYLDRGKYSFISHMATIERAIFSGYGMMLLPILVGFVMVIYLYFWRRSVHRSFRDTLTKDAFASLLLSFPAPVVWSLIDFQGYPDFYVFLPYIAIGFGMFLDLVVQRAEGAEEIGPHEGTRRFLTIGLCLALAMLAWINVHLGRESGLGLQVQAAHEIEERFGKDFRLLSLGVPEVLVVLHRTNPTPYVLIGPSTYHWIEDKTPGGFEGWLQELEGYNPDAIAFRPIGKGIHTDKLKEWLKSRYHEEQTGPWRIYVKGSLDE